MKQILFASLLFLAISAAAQQKEGKVVYERTMQMQVSFAGMNDEMQRMIPRSRTDKFELIFSGNQSIYQQAEKEPEEDHTMSDGEGGMQVRIVAQGANDVMYTNFETGKRVDQREIMDKKFIVDDTIRPLKWKMTGETRTILGHPCMKATATQISQRMQTNIENGKMERKEITDTSSIIAWFASDIPVPAGPSEFQGQLPGLILEMDIANGRQVYKAVELKEKADVALIREPTGKKHYTPEEFRKEREKMMDQMRQNGGGPGRVMRFN